MLVDSVNFDFPQTSGSEPDADREAVLDGSLLFDEYIYFRNKYMRKMP